MDTVTPTPADREPLPAGHPITWGVLTDGTVLEGAPYDYRPPYSPLAMLARSERDPAQVKRFPLIAVLGKAYCPNDGRNTHYPVVDNR